jgi:hypothetical protein
MALSYCLYDGMASKGKMINGEITSRLAFRFDVWVFTEFEFGVGY